MYCFHATVSEFHEDNPRDALVSIIDTAYCMLKFNEVNDTMIIVAILNKYLAS